MLYLLKSVLFNHLATVIHLFDLVSVHNFLNIRKLFNTFNLLLAEFTYLQD